MNQNIFKTIFSKVTGTYVAVSEITAANGKAVSESNATAEKTSSSWGSFALKQINFLLMLVMGAISIPANSQVIGDSNAPGNQRPVVLNTASGATQINIQTPSASGVSVNQYSRFDTTAPTVLNNSRVNINTTTAGMVTANPYLATGSARVIVNQVNGSVAHLNNSLEIAGNRADLVIAAPAGIVVNGGSIINASKTTLTTGAPIINGGSLEGYRVTGGEVSVDGKGFDDSQSDYTNIISRSVKLNAGVWSKDLTVTAGANQVAVDGTSTAIAGTGTGTAPTYALDSSALGGMYSQKITFQSSERGVGINNAGTLSASAGNVAITADGLLSNSGSISSNGNSNSTQINTTAVHNSGTISAQGDTQVQTSAELQNSGTVTSGRELKVVSSTIDNTNGVLSGQRLDLTANSLTNKNGKIQQTGATQSLNLNAGGINNTNGGVIGYAPAETPTGGTGGSTTGGTGAANGTDDTPSTATGGGTSTVTLAPVLPSLANGAINVSGAIDNDAGQITANGGMDLSTSNGLTNGGTLNLNKLNVTGAAFDNTNGTVTTTQLDVNTNTITNINGKLGSSGKVTLTAQTLTNTKGQITSDDTTIANITGTVLNDDGTIAATNNVTLNAGSINNTRGVIASNKAAATVTSLGEINNTAGKIQAKTALNLTSAALDNSDGMISGAATNIDTNGNALTNDRGSIMGDDLTINSGAIANDAGLIQGTNTTTINTHGQTLTNTNSGTKGILSGGTLNLQTGNVTNTAGVISSNGAAQISAADVSNTDGTIHSDAQLDLTANSLSNTNGKVTAGAALNANIAQSVTSSGTIASDDALTLNAGSLDNSGTIGSNKAATAVKATGAVKNSGIIQAATQLDLTSTSLDNTDGKVNAVGATTVNTGTGALNNTRGTVSGTDTKITSGATVNDAGLIQGTDSLNINTSGQTLTNTNTNVAGKGIVSGGKLDIASGNLDNTSGKISSTGDNTIAANAINNQNGAIKSQANTTMIGANLDNQNGQIQTEGNTSIAVGSGTVNNQNGLIRSNGDTSIASSSLNNSNTNGADKGIEGTNVTINANNLDNTSGAIRADETLAITGNGTVNNTSGLITSAAVVAIKDSNPSAKILTVINTGGTIAAGTSSTIDAKSLTADGKLTSQGDLSIGITNDFNNTSELTANGNLTLNTTGTITNTSKITAGETLTLGSNQLYNEVTGEISGADTHLNTADAIFNRGLIDGGATTVIKTQNLNNIGTGRIYGDHISIATDRLNNIDEIVGGVTKAATIAARDQLDIGANVILNKEHASIISLGDMHIGGALDSNNIATGSATTLNNESATIDAGDKLSISVGQLNNINKHFATTQTVVGTEQRYYFTGNAARDAYVDASQAQLKNEATGEILTNPNLATYDVVLNNPHGRDVEFYYRDVVAETSRTTIAQSDPSKITSGGAMDLTIGNVRNDKSQIISGGALTVTGGTIDNINATGTQQTIERGKVIHTDRNGGNRWFDVEDNNYVHEENPTTIDLDGIAVVLHDTNATNSNTVAAHTTSTAAADAAGANAATANNAYAANGITEVAGNGNALNSDGTSAANIIRTTGVNTNLPNSSLFSVNPNGSGYLVQTDPRFTDSSKWLSSDYLLKALNFDPATAHKRLGDGYYEQKLIKEQIAQLTGRRYLDGQTSDDDQYKNLMNAGVTFATTYNLRPGIALTNEQMARLTSDIVWLIEEEVTLPDGTKTKVLVPKVYVRTKPGDITGAGALISGDSVKIDLNGDVNNQGTISGRKLTKISGENINNLNGHIGGGDATILNAKTDINNIGGVIDANNVLSAKAGRDINVITTTNTVSGRNGGHSSTDNYSSTAVDRIAGLYVNNPDGLLLVDAGRDANLKGADIITNDGGVISVKAGNDVNLSTVEVGESTRNTAHYQNTSGHNSTSSTAEVGTVINGGAVYIDAGNNVNARQADVAANDGVLAISAGKDVNIEAGKATEEASSEFGGKRGKTKFNMSSETSASTDVGSSLSGQGVVIKAGNDFTATAANIDAGDGQLYVKAGHDITIEEGHSTFESTTHEDSKKKSGLFGINKKSGSKDEHIESNTSISSNLSGDSITLIAGNNYEQSGSNVMGVHDVAIQAGNNATIESSQDTYSENDSSSNKKSGFTGGYSAGVLSIGFGKSKSNAQNSVESVAQHASTIGSEEGNVSIKAGNQMTIAASDVAAAKDVTLIAKDIDLEARQDTVVMHGEQSAKSSGISLGITVNPYAAGKAAYDQSKANSAVTGSTMNKIINEFRASNAALAAATTPIVFTAGSKRSSSEQNHLTSNARVDTFTAGGNFTMIATDGSIDSQGAQMSAEGSALFLAKDSINLDVAHNYESKDTDNKSSGWGIDNRGGPNLWDIAGVYKNKANGAGNTDTVTGSQLSVGGKATLVTQTGDINITGSNIAANDDVNVSAARNLTIESAQDTSTNENHSKNKAIGKVQISDTEAFAGYHSEKHNDNADQINQVGSNVGSLGGTVNLTAGGAYTQTASNVLAAEDINVTAKTIDINEAQNTGTTHVDDKSLKIGIFARIKSPLIDLINNIDASKKSDGRLQGLQQGAAVANGVSAVTGAIGAVTDGAQGSGSLASVEMGIGVASAKNRDDTSYSIAQSSALNAGGNINLKSTEGDIHATGANITAGQTLSLDSAQNIILDASQNHTETSGKNNSWGVEAGVGASVGAQTGVYVYVKANMAKGKYETDVTSNNNTHLNAETINIKSKGDTTLSGADAHASTINADVGGTLAITSLQDTAEQHSEQTSAGFQVQGGFGTAWGGSGNFGQSNTDGSYTGVNQQSGLFAGDGGYHVKADKVALTGGAITSTNAANSDLTANSLTFTDLKNKSEYSTDSTNISGGYGGGQSLVGAIATNVVSNLGNIIGAMSKAPTTNDESTTKATLTEGNITIGGNTSTAAATGINTDAATAHRALSELPDLRAALAQQEAETKALNDIGAGVSNLVNTSVKYGQSVAVADARAAANDYNQAFKDADGDATDSAVVAAQTKLEAANTLAAHWGPDGRYAIAANAVGTIINGIAADKDPKAIAALIAAPLIAKAIGDNIGSDNPAAKFAAHAVTAGVIAVLGGADTKEALAAAIATGATEAFIAPAIAKALYGDKFDPQDPEQHQVVLALSGISGAIIAGIAGNSNSAAQFGASGTFNAVENNYLYHSEAEKLFNLNAEYNKFNCSAHKTDRFCTDIDDQMKRIQKRDQIRNLLFAESCSKPGDACDQARLDLDAAIESYDKGRGLGKYDLVQYLRTYEQAAITQGNVKGLADRSTSSGLKQSATNAAILAGTELTAGAFRWAKALRALERSSAVQMEQGTLIKANFAQTSIRSDGLFSKQGQEFYSELAGFDIKTVNALANAIKSGKISPSQIPVDYVDVAGTRLILNTRTSTALEQAGVPRAEWMGRNQTGQQAYPGVSYLDLAIDQLNKNKLPLTGSPTLGAR